MATPQFGREGRGPRVLVVEDQFLLSLHVAQILGEMGCEVVGPAASLDEAEPLVKEGKFDAAVLNYRLDHVTTAELARRLVGAGVPVLFLSGMNGETGVPPDLRELAWVRKPASPEALTRALGELINRINRSR